MQISYQGSNWTNKFLTVCHEGQLQIIESFCEEQLKYPSSFFRASKLKTNISLQLLNQNIVVVPLAMSKT